MTMNDLEEGPGGPHQGPAPKELARSSKSRMRLAGLMETAEEKTKGKPPVVRAAVMAEVEKLDRNEDGVVDGGELADALVSICKGSLAAGQELAAEKKKSAMLRAGALLAVVAAVVMGAVGFGSNVAATRMEKDARVQGGGSTALVTRDLKAVSTNTNEVQSTLAVLPWLSVETRSHVDKVDFMVPDEKGAFERHERVAAVDIQTREGVRVTTVLGTTLQWSRLDKENVFVTLADGSSWTAPAACQRCLVLNILDSDEVSEAKDLFHQDVGMALHQGGRLLKGDPCLPDMGGASALGGGSDIPPFPSIAAGPTGREPTSVSAAHVWNCPDSDQRSLEIWIEYDNDHEGEGTWSDVCLAPMTEPWLRKCGIPLDKHGWLATRHYRWRFCPGDWVKLEVWDGGEDAFLVDQIKVTDYFSKDLHGTIGRDNSLGWCLSEDTDSLHGFGGKAYQAKCCANLEIEPVNLKWRWGC